MTSVCKLALFTILVLCTMYSTVEAHHCRIIFIRVCRNGGCRIFVIRHCPSHLGKRSLNDKPGKKVPFPDKFDNYDADKNGGITLEELAKTTKVNENAKLTRKAFQKADKDGDGQIDCSEFKAAPYLFAHQPSCWTERSPFFWLKVYTYIVITS